MDNLARTIDQFWFKSKDYCDKPDDPRARQLQDAIKHLHDEAQANKAPDYLFERAKQIESMVQNLKNNEGIYSPGDVDDMYDRCQDLKKDLRELSAAS